MDFKITEDNFKLSGQDFYVFSGEIHYFRIRPENWAAHLKKAKAANLNTISTYIPWDWHEYEEGKFDFSGHTNPQRNLLGFIELCKKNGLYLIVKPGPYILAEYLDHGIPQWLLSSHPEILALNREGKTFGHARVTLMHPVYLKYARLWYDKILAIIKDNLITKSGGIILSMQLCNEIGVFTWLDKEADHNPVSLDHYRKFLSEKYKKINRLNVLYKAKYKSFSSVVPPQGNPAKLTELAADLDWHLFWRRYYAVYVEHLLKEVTKSGIHIPFTHNLPGWVWGRAVEYPLNITMYQDVAKLYPKVMLAVDHIPENISYRNFHDAAIIQQFTRAIQGNRGPTFVAEMQAGTREHNVVTYPDELELFYKSALAYGAAGMNFYMFSQGKNPKGKSAVGPTFYWQTPLDYDGKETALYPVVRRFGKLASAFGALASRAKADSKVALLFYKPYYYTELTHNYDLEKMGLSYNPKTIRDSIFYEGMAKILKMLNCDYDILDMELTKPKDLAKYKQAWIVSLEYMDAESQKLLANYVGNGGHLVILPRVPKYDLSLKPCEVLRQFLKIGETEEVSPRAPTIDFFDVKEISVFNPIEVFNEPNAEPMALLPDGSTCGFVKHFGGGWALVLGTAFGYSTEESIDAYSRILKMDDIRGNASPTNGRMVAQEFFDEGRALLFVANYYRTAESGHIIFADPVTKEEKKMPYGAPLTLAGLTGLIIPVNFQIHGSAARIIFSTSQILNAFEKGGSIFVELHGQPGSGGELTVAIKKRPKQVFADGRKLEFSYRSGEAIIPFKHSDEGPVLMKINLN
ncbi:MAG: beta-galactosidase [Candidatus Omnitrophota bacterium]|jgi:beta-galactosidase